MLFLNLFLTIFRKGGAILIKRKKYFLIILMLFLFIPNIVYAQTNSSYCTAKNISSKKNTTKINGYIPVIKNLTNPIFEYNLNSSIKNSLDTYTDEAVKNKASTFNVNFDVVENVDYLSIILYFTNQTKKTSEIQTFVLNRKTNSYVSINSFLGGNGLSYVNKYISNKINKDKTTKYFNFTGVTSSTPFYIQNDNINVIFGAGKIAATSKGNIVFSVPTKNLSNYNLSANLYYLKSKYNVKMLPLRNILEHFGYSLTWNSKTNQITISKNRVNLAKLTVGKNSYTKMQGPTSNKVLEFAPEIRNGITYVPISFFEQMLDFLFSSDDHGNVTISKYTLY